MTERFISVSVPYDGEGRRGSETWWAVRPPEDPYEENTPGGWEPVSPRPEEYWVMGEPRFPVQNVRDLEGWRRLLDAIEADMTGASADAVERD